MYFGCNFFITVCYNSFWTWKLSVWFYLAALRHGAATTMLKPSKLGSRNRIIPRINSCLYQLSIHFRVYWNVEDLLAHDTPGTLNSYLMVSSFFLMVSCRNCKLWLFVVASNSIPFISSSVFFSCILSSAFWVSTCWRLCWVSLSCWHSTLHSSQADWDCCSLSSLSSLVL